MRRTIAWNPKRARRQLHGQEAVDAESQATGQSGINAIVVRRDLPVAFPFTIDIGGSASQTQGFNDLRLHAWVEHEIAKPSVI
ncbi:hypothetical protein LL974_03810 [Xanthomonas campestris pv. cannae]|nr:hypothetical protein [Xanthomonas campestris pv. cannae]